MSTNWFAHMVVYHPYIILAVVTVFSGSCLVIPFTVRSFPDFSDPQMGFETRGTMIAKRVTTWKNLMEATRPSGALVVNPKEYTENKKLETLYKDKKPKRKKPKKFQKSPTIYVNELSYNHSGEPSKGINWTRLRHELQDLSEMIIPRNHRLEESQKAGFFCGAPDEGYSQIVLKSLNGSDLFNLHSLLSMCRIERELIQAKHYKELCIQTVEKPKKCCRPWSLANYIALLHNRKSCLALTEEDVHATKALLKNCSQYYHTLKITADCTERGFCKAPLECIRHDAVYNIMNFLTDIFFLSPKGKSEAILTETMMFLPLACSTAMLPYYHEIENIDLEYEGISVVAMEFGLKNALFDECLLRDAWLMTSGGLFVLFCMWLYTGSLFLTFMTIIAIVFSLGISYFMYIFVFDLRFFPFMNLLATVVAVGIGADDAFIFCKMWYTSKQEKKSSMVKLMSDTFHHAFFSIFVLSLTTAVAFLASYVSSITAICCFSVFAGTAVISNCLLMMTWFPACVVIWERSCQTSADVLKSCLMASFQRPFCPRFIQSLSVSSAWLKCKCSYIGKLWMAKEQLLLNSIVNFRITWLTLLTVVAMASGFIVLYYPKLQLPSSPDFQLFDSSHLFEQYDLVYKNRFWFKREQRVEAESTVMKLPLRFVWGLLPTDTGNHLDPQSRGELQFDPTFDMSDPKSQTWLLNFCRRLRQQPFYQSTLGPLLPNCFIESFMASMQRRCFDSFDNINRTPCCESVKFPYNHTVFDTCIVDAIADLYETPSEFFIPGVAGPKFSKDQYPTIKVVVVEYDSNYTYSMSYNYMHQFFTAVENWMQEELKTAPDSMKNGWFISELEFYDLQRELSDCTVAAIGMSMALALVVLLLSTLNVMTSLYAIITITCSIFVTMAVLVLLGWKLNVLESVAVSTAIGLTVDFSLHYTVNYSMCPAAVTKDRKAATRYALSNMAGPAAMAALTTGAAGAFMMPSLVLAYIQIGIFLVTVMAVSWFYATFHLGSMLAVAGPQNQFGQFNYNRICFLIRGSKTGAKEYDQTRPTVSSISDTHELDSLTSKSSVRPMPKALQRSFSGSKSNQNKYIFTDQSPSATSAITIITTEEN